ncbi:hypothetical protein ScPMuIL_005120 [Solemya velum]
MEEDHLYTLNVSEGHCKAVYAHIISRHGIRNPGAKDIRKMTELQKKIIEHMDSDIFPFIERWTNRYFSDEEKLLTENGELEQFLLGRKFAKYFRSLLANDLDNLNFVVTSKQRAKTSGAFFYKGLSDYFGEHYEFRPHLEDTLLRFHDICEHYKYLVDVNRSFLSEYYSFMSGDYVRNVTESVSQRLGVSKKLIASADVRLLFHLCAFEMANYNESDWCDLMNDEERKVIEYSADLKQYLKKAYGHRLMGEMSCPLVKNIFENLDYVVAAELKGEKHSPATFMFGHAETLAPLFAGLGLFKDILPLTANNYQFLQNRSFRSSWILPFSSNLAFILYHCKANDLVKKPPEQFPLRLVMNGKPVSFPVCNKTICPYRTVRESYTVQVDNCNFADICQLRKDIHSEL